MTDPISHDVGRASSPGDEPIDGLLPATEPMVIDDIREALLINEQAVFLLTDADGNVPHDNRRGLGLYRDDARHLSAYRLTLNGTPLVLLLSTAQEGFAMEQVLTNPALESADGRRVERGTIEIRRLRVVGDGLQELLSLQNFNQHAVTLNLLLEFNADFADIFDVRGYERESAAEHEQPVVERATIRYASRGTDGRRRVTAITFDQTPAYADATTALFRVTLGPRGAHRLRISVAMSDAPSHETDDVSDMIATLSGSYRDWRSRTTEIETDNLFVNQVIDRSLRDLRMLWRADDEGQAYPSAGTPWFDALFGRDSCIVGMQTLAFQPDIARHVLKALAALQGQTIEAARDEEPGKILHERRESELSRAGELPYARYYGSVDSTPLFMMLAGAYFAWTGDVAFLRDMVASLRLAFQWLREYGGLDGSGMLTYEKRAIRGLVNQGWKDSVDSIPHADGALAQPPIALIEAQTYVYAALTSLEAPLERIGEHDLASQFRSHADAIHKLVDEKFWDEDAGTYALAIDGERGRVRSIASNAGHALWCGFADEQKAAAIADALMSDELYSGWGIRTLGKSHPRFNPNGYHVGSVWPHDNSLIAMGLKMYGFEDHVHRLARSLLDVAVSYPYFRLPELFGGQTRSEPWNPVPYAVACRPQAWAAGSFLLVMQALLGLHAQAPESILRVVRPTLPHWLNNVHVRNLRVGDGSVSLTYRRRGHETEVDVDRAHGRAKVVLSRRWPLPASAAT